VLWQKTMPGGYDEPQSTLRVQVLPSVASPFWTEQHDLIHSTANDPHFVVEVDENLRSLVRFGNGTNGESLPDNAVVTCQWLSGFGPDGNAGPDSLVGFDSPAPNAVCWNPFDITDGLAPEPPSSILRRVPEAYLFDQQRAVTLADYEDCAEQVPGVLAAYASYAWTGSWRTVRIAVEPVGSFTLTAGLRSAVEQRLEALHLIGEDLEVRAPEYVPLKISVSLCVSNNFWIEQVSPVVVRAFSDGYTDTGEAAFFNPSRWTFGRPLYASQIEGVLQNIEGVEHVISIVIQQWQRPWIQSSEVMTVAPNQIIEVQSDPSEIESGWIDFNFEGGRQ
jgi:predicted phage baseplate assembly protein